jgi:ABC-2 type transport system permease protein
MLVLPLLLGGAIASLSNALALVTRQEESLIGAVQFVVLPASFLSAGMMAFNLMPGWIQAIARFNPVNWTVAATRTTEWAFVGERAALLAALVLVCGWVATRAFGVYQRAV